MTTEVPFLNLRSLMENSFRQFAELPAISFVDETPVTFRTLQQEVRLLMLDLLKNGVKHGDRVAILGDNSPN